jgi:peptide/nickel transport system substrate-binding protein
MFPIRRGYGLLVILIALSWLVVACGGAQPAAPEAPAPQAEPAKSEQPAAAEQPAAEGPSQLRVTFAWPTFIDPAVGNDYAGSTALANLYDTLVFPKADGTMVPWLAESWEVSDDGLTWTFKLRQGVKFHDGSELKASDVVYSFNRLQTVGEGYAYLLANVKSATAVDDATVEFTLPAPSALFVPSLVRLYILNEDLVRQNTLAEGPYGENGDYGKEWLLTHDAGSGPYMVKEFPLEEYLLMEKFKDWWGEFHPDAPDLVRFVGGTETATVRALMANGELEITDQWQTIEAFQALDQIEAVDVAAFPTMTEFYYMMNTRLAPLDDVHCRRAIAYAFDYDAAVALEWPGTQQSRGPVPMTLAGHNPDVFVFKRDLDKAREELAQCKYANDIANYPIEVTWISEVPAEEKWALLFQANMQEIGIPVEVVTSPWLSVVENTSAQETSPHIVTIYVSSDLPEAGLMIQQRYHSSTANSWQQNEWLLDPALDAEIEDALETVEDQERFAKYHTLQDKIVELSPSLFLYDMVEKHAYRADYVDWPAARGETSAVMGYQIYAPHIGVKK